MLSLGQNLYCSILKQKSRCIVHVRVKFSRLSKSYANAGAVYMEIPGSCRGTGGYRDDDGQPCNLCVKPKYSIWKLLPVLYLPYYSLNFNRTDKVTRMNEFEFIWLKELQY